MKAIVLTFDDHLEIANLVVESYQRLWPGCPVVFRVPHTDRDPKTIFRGTNLELVYSESSVRATMERLLARLHDEFVFWCICDRYPIELREPIALDALYQFILKDPPQIEAIRLAAAFRAGVQTLDTSRPLVVGSMTYYRQPRLAFGFYMPQFVRARLLKTYFFSSELPAAYRIRELHDLVLQAPPVENVYVPEKSLFSIGEATIRGSITAHCCEQMEKLGLPLPAIPRTEHNRLYT